ncbi:MAG: AsmA family protein [Moraxellaceae bacterium]|nr:AsmA family protein [Moraxellaceae bacterium]
MSKVAKIVAIIVASLLTLVLAFVGFILFVIDPNDYKTEIYSVVKDKTDMDLAINERIEWQLWPNVGLKLGKVTLTDTAAQQTLVAINQASVSVQVMPLLSKKIAIDSVNLDGAQLSFIQYTDGKTSWDTLLNKLKNQPEEESEKIEFNVSLLNISNSALAFKDEKTNTQGQLEQLLVQATNIDLTKAFPVRIKFSYSQKDGQGKTLIADNDLNTTIQLNQDAQIYTLKGFTARSHLQGTLLPAPMVLDVKADMIADMLQEQHQIDNLNLSLDYQDPKLKSPAHVQMTANILAKMKPQLINVAALKLNASYPQASLKSPATINVQGDITADLAAQQVNMPNLLVEANYPDAARPAPITATLKSVVNANLKTGALTLSPLDLQANISDKAFPKVMPIHLTAPITANFKEGKIALNGFSLDALAIKTTGQLQASLPALAANAAPNTPTTQGMSMTGNINTSSFNLRQLMQDLGMKAPAMKNADTLKTVSVSSQISGTEQAVLLKGLKVQLDGSTLTGEAGLSDINKNQKVMARLALDKINVDDYLPPTDPNAKPSTGGLLPIELLKQQNLDVALSIGALTVMDYPIKQFQVSAIANGGLVQVSKLSGSIYNGTFNLPSTIDVRGKEPVLSVAPNINQIEIANLAKQFTKQDLLTGKATYQGKVQMMGNSVPAWTSSLTGNSSIKFDNGVLKGVNMMQLVLNEMGKYQALLPYLTGKNADTIASKQNDTQIASFVGEAEIKNGLVQTKALNADLRKAKIDGSGTFNLVTMDVDYNIKLQLSKDAVSDNVAQYPFPIRCKGNISKPASLCSVDSRAVKDIATNALLNSEKAQKLKAELEAKKTEAQAKAQEKLNEALQKNGVKLGEEGQKAAEQINKQLGDKIGNQLNKLFKRE